MGSFAETTSCLAPRRRRRHLLPATISVVEIIETVVTELVVSVRVVGMIAAIIPLVFEIFNTARNKDETVVVVEGVNGAAIPFLFDYSGGGVGLIPLLSTTATDAVGIRVGVGVVFDVGTLEH
jgi:hypothetical protein